MNRPEPPSSGLLTRLSASPSPSSSSFSSSSSFDPHAHPDEKEPEAGAGPSTLGLRELAKMRKEERRRKKVSTTSTGTGDDSPHRQGTPGRGGRQEVKLVSSVIGAGTDLPFATDVQIRGWKIVGGRSWTDIGRIGAYVGTYPTCPYSLFAHLTRPPTDPTENADKW